MKPLKQILPAILLAFLFLAPLMGPAPARAAAAPAGDVAPGSAGPSNATAVHTLRLPLMARTSPGNANGWRMAGANPQRTSWVPEEVKGNLRVAWYRPIEAYIPQNAQLIAADGLIYVSTAAGLYALNAATGAVAWRYDTELPLGNSPTVVDGIVYVGGYDRQIHALDGQTGRHLWAYVGAGAGFSTNPLVVDGLVIAGNRDGYMYALGAQNTPQQGRLVWKYRAGGPILVSAAYNNGVVYFAANDNYAYALRADTGTLMWKSGPMPGDGYQSYWPVIYQDKVIFSGASGYRNNGDPGTSTLKNGSGAGYATIQDVERDDVFFDKADGSPLGPVVTLDADWARGRTVMDGSRAAEYLENNPVSDPHLHKPWRRVTIVLNMTDGSEYTFDSDHDGAREYTPILLWGTRSGNRYPPLVGNDGLLWASNVALKMGIPQGRIMGWKLGTPYFVVGEGAGAVDEPQAISAGGNVIYQSICCDRVGAWFTITTPEQSGTYWNYSTTLSQLAPGYDSQWWGIDRQAGYQRLEGNYGDKNGLYHNHGDQNPIIPYAGRVYIHRSNAVIAFGPGGGPGQLPLLTRAAAASDAAPVSLPDLQGRLGSEVQKMLDAGHLRPGYYNMGQWAYPDLGDYFDNPADTILTLARAYPYLSATLQERTKTYLKNEFQTYFEGGMFARTGWADGAPREAMPMPPDLQSALPKSQKTTFAGYNWSWRYPQGNFYAMWKYAQLFPADAPKVYALAKSKIETPPSDEYLATYPYEHNAWIAGCIGLLKLQEMAGMTVQDASIRTTVTNNLNRLLALRASAFQADTPWIDPNNPNLPAHGGKYHYRTLNVARNFMMLAPEVADYLRQNALGKVQAAVNEYNRVAPYWFVARYEAVPNEGVMSNLYTYNAMFQAKAYVLKETRTQLVKYLDVSAFMRGDLLYIQDLIAAIEAPGGN